MKRKVGRKTVKRRKERIAGTNMKRRQWNLRPGRHTAGGIGSGQRLAYINTSLSTTPHPPDTNNVIQIL
jgi:hypothetical protein